MKDKKFIFVGNRFFVLEEMLKKELNLVRILAVKNSYLERTLQAKKIKFSLVESKSELVSVLESTDFDYLLANGCPFILPISQLQNGNKVFINVHPSPLPDLRGVDPVPGALLLNKDSGATCHVMDDGIDTGKIISRVIIPNTNDLDAGLLYQMSFLAEKEAFDLALDRTFRPQIENVASPDCVYYTKKLEDLMIDFQETSAQIIFRIKAFSNKSQGARFNLKNSTFKVFDVEEVQNPYLKGRIEQYQENQVVFNYESSLLIRHGHSFLKLKDIEGEPSLIQVGDIL